MAMRSDPDAVSAWWSSSSLPRDRGRRLSDELLRKLHADLALLPSTSSDNNSQPGRLSVSDKQSETHVKIKIYTQITENRNVLHMSSALTN